MPRILAAIAVAAMLAGCAGSDFQMLNLEQGNALRVDPSTAPGADYVVTIRNVGDPLTGYNPDDQATRNELAVRFMRAQCPAARVVGESAITTGQFLTGRAAKTYSIRIKC